MTDQTQQFAKQFIEGEWFYNTKDKILKKTFSSKQQLTELKLIDAEGYLDSNLKKAIKEALGNQIVDNAVGSFGDSDIFSGEIFDDTTLYNLEFHNVTDEMLDLIEKLPNVEIKIVEL